LKSQFLATNTLIWIEVPEGKLIDIAISGAKTRLERKRSVSAKDKISQKRKTQEKQVTTPKEVIPIKQATR
jgi:hypothetical protein